MLTPDGAFDRIGSALRDKGFTVAKEGQAPDSPETDSPCSRRLT